MNQYEIITDIIIERLKKGEIPWRSPFRGSGMRCSNFISKKAYRGFNALITSSMGFKSPYFMTFNQIRKLEGAKLKKGSKGVFIAVPISGSYLDDDGKAKTFLKFKKAYVFNLDQIDGIECPVTHKLEEEIEEAEQFVDMEPCEKFIEEIKPNLAKILHLDNFKACYIPFVDVIKIAFKENFKTEEDYYSTLFHEIGHSTGHESKLNRDMSGKKRSKAYAREELVAEISASFMCAETGVLNRTVDNHSAYIESWLKALKNDPQMILKASSEAEKVMDYLLTFKIEEL